MRQAFNDVEITRREGLEGTYGLAEPDDEHVVAPAVVAPAVVAGAGAIITLNTKDFPAALPTGWKPSDQPSSPPTPCLLPRPAPCTPIQAIANSTGTRGPTRTVTELLNILVRQYGFDDAVDQLRNIQ